MAVKYRMLPDGGFVAGSTETGLASYAYPTSTYATLARRQPERIAAEMAGKERPTDTHDRSDYDARNWTRING